MVLTMHGRTHGSPQFRTCKPTSCNARWSVRAPLPSSPTLHACTRSGEEPGLLGVEAKIARHVEALRLGAPEAAAAAVAALGRIGEDDVAGSLRWPDALAGLGLRLQDPQGSPSRDAALRFLLRLFRYFEALPSSVQMAQVFAELARSTAALPPGDPGLPELAEALAETGRALPRRWQGLPGVLLADATAARVELLAGPHAAAVEAADPLGQWCAGKISGRSRSASSPPCAMLCSVILSITFITQLKRSVLSFSPPPTNEQAAGVDRKRARPRGPGPGAAVWPRRPECTRHHGRALCILARQPSRLRLWCRRCSRHRASLRRARAPPPLLGDPAPLPCPASGDGGDDRPSRSAARSGRGVGGLRGRRRSGPAAARKQRLRAGGARAAAAAARRRARVPHESARARVLCRRCDDRGSAAP